MATLSDEQLRALRFLARHPGGCTEATLLRQGFTAAQLGYLERQPQRPPSKAIAIHESTDGPAILRRVFSEPIEPDTDDLRDEVA